MTGAGFAAYGLDGDFTAAYLAARRVADLAERDPAAVAPSIVAALADLLTRNDHARQTQARILYRDAAGALVTLLARGPAELASASRAALELALGTPGKPRLAAAEAVGALPLPGLAGPAVTVPEPVAEPIAFAGLLEAAGTVPGTGLVRAGRSLLAARRESGTLLVVKRLRQGEDPLGLVREAAWMEHCAGLDFPAPCHVPVPLGRGRARLWAVADAPFAGPELDDRGRCLAYLARADYFAYPNTPGRDGGPDAAAFAEAMGRAALLLGWLAGRGIVHEAAIPLFHNRVQRGRREDGGLYDWRLPGRLDRWLHSALHPNFGLSGIRDFEHLASVGDRPVRLYRQMGDHLISLFLVAGSYFRMRDPDLVGHGPDGAPVDARHLFDEALLARVLDAVAARYQEGFVGRPAAAVPFDAAALARRMVEEMGVDRHMTELLRLDDQAAMTDAAFAEFLLARGMAAGVVAGLRRGEAEVAIPTGPHLGAFNSRTSLPELGEATAAAVAACLAARHDRDRSRTT
ncbi:SidJ-related pseudokinase [Solidesulfovibrio sp.]